MNSPGLALVLFVLGAGLVGFSIYVELNHKKIWENYLKDFKQQHHGHAEGETFQENLRAPSKLMYKINIWFIWPLMALLGLLSIYTGFQAL